jgi:Mg-chelatase subunit ChlD
VFGFADPPPAERQTPRWKFHAFRNQLEFKDCIGNGRNAKEAADAVIKQRNDLFETGKRVRNPGVFLHSFQDEVPHAGFGSAWGHNFNPDKPTESTEAARKAGLHIGGSVDWLSFHDKIVSVNLVYDTASWLGKFMDEVPVKEKRRQRRRVFEFADSETMLDALRDQNVAPPSFAVNELPTYIQFYKASLGLGTAPALTADQKAKFNKHKDGPNLGQAEAIVVAAMKRMGMIEGGIPPLAQARKEFTFSPHGAVTSPLDKWVLYGALEVTFEDNSRQPKPVEVVVKAPATMRGETEYDLTEPVEMRGGETKRWEDMPVGEVIIELRRDGKRLTEKRVTIDELVEKVTISPTVNKSVLFLIDTSGSMAGAKLENAKRAAESAVRARATEGEEWALLSFDGHNVTVQRDFGTDVEAFAVSARNLRAGSDTPLVWAVTQAVMYLFANANAPVGQVVILSDGGENCQERSPKGSKAAVDGLNRVLSNLRLGAVSSSQRVAAAKKPRLLAMAGDDARWLAYLQARNSVPRVLGQSNQTVDDALRELQQVVGQTRRRTSISIIGFDIQGAADEQQLRSIAQAGGGGYFPANDANALQNALGQAASGATGDSGGSKGGWLGIWAQTTTAQQVQVLWVEQGSPADGRLQPGDILLAVDQTPLTSVQQLTSLLAGKKTGDALTLRVRQSKQEQTIALSLGNATPTHQRTIIVNGAFQGQSFAGNFIGYLDPNRKFSYGVMSGKGVNLDGTFEGTWDPSSGAVDLPFKGRVKVLANFSLKGAIRGQVDPTGRGSGTFEGRGAVGVERGTWTCVPLVSPHVVAL